jgi:hypothetical protein
VTKEIHTGVTSAVKKNCCSGFLIVRGNGREVNVEADATISAQSQSLAAWPEPAELLIVSMYIINKQRRRRKKRGIARLFGIMNRGGGMVERKRLPDLYST